MNTNAGMDQNSPLLTIAMTWSIMSFMSTSKLPFKREKRLKKWKRAYKDNLITGFNPEWCDLFDEVKECQ
jgi:predicted GIY-YIG superfamily endonuclease